MKINPWRDEYKREVVELVEQRDFPLGVPDPADPDRGELVLSLTLRAMDDFARSKMSDLNAEWTERYVEGVGDEKPAVLTLPDKSIAQLSDRLLYNVACVTTMQVVDNEDDRYTLLEWLGWIKVFPLTWREIQRWMIDLDKRYRELLEKRGRGQVGNSAGNVETTGE